MKATFTYNLINTKAVALKANRFNGLYAHVPTGGKDIDE